MSTMTGTVTAPIGTGYSHEADHGFCIVCGGVWPCARATATDDLAPLPIPRLSEGDTAV